MKSKKITAQATGIALIILGFAAITTAQQVREHMHIWQSVLLSASPVFMIAFGYERFKSARKHSE